MPSQSSVWLRNGIVLVAAVVLVISGVAYVRNTGEGKVGRNAFVLSKYACPAGTYQTGQNAQGCVCTACPVGHKCPGGINGPKTPCSKGSYQGLVGQSRCRLASPGNYVPGLGATKQTQCKAGSYQPSSGASSCLPAPKGQSVPNPGSSSAIPCSPGNYQPAPGQVACLLSPPGSSVPGSGAVSPTPCKPGFYRATKGAVNCLAASKGNYVPKEGAIQQTKCPHGEYQNLVGQKACKPASPGNFVPTTGASQQTPCVANKYQPCGGQVECIPCRPGQSSRPGAVKCGYIARACVNPRGSVASTFAKVTIPKSGKLKAIDVKYINGEFKYCGDASPSNCRGYYGIRDVNHGFDLYFTRRDPKAILFPKSDTIGMTPKIPARFPRSFPFYLMAGKNAGSTQPVTYATNSPQQVAQGEELRVYAGEVLFQYHPSDNRGQVCYDLAFTIV